ncbi:hypothetical protein Tco_1056523 [Tanacetum coccineum]|uniref:Reverse transcriptase domain-containing protein n=1 Tax=Tanacetum coccineum TaxID=301880 RepID=A0ABQ5H3U8_9ASTR
MPTLRTAEVYMIKNNEALEINLGLLEEKREQAAIQEANNKTMMEKYYNARFRNTSFKLGDIIYRSNEASHAEDGGKLGPKWEGPCKVTEALGNGALVTDIQKKDKTKHGMEKREKVKVKVNPKSQQVKAEAESKEILNGPSCTYLMGPS